MVALKNHGTTRPFFEAHPTSVFLLRCQRLIYWMMHLTTFAPTVSIHRVGAGFIIGVVMLHIHVSTHSLAVCLHVLFKLLELLRI